MDMKEAIATHVEVQNGYSEVYAIILAKDWFKGMKLDYPVIPTDHVVCKWWDYTPEGEKSKDHYLEGKVTLAIFRFKTDAEAYFELYEQRLRY